MNILIGILKYPPDYAGDGMRLHRTFQRLKKKGNVQNIQVLTSWDQNPPSREETLDGVSIHRPVECTLKPEFRHLFKRMAFLSQIVKVITCYAKLSPKPDLVLTSGSGWLPSLIAWLAFFDRKPLVKEIVLLGSDDPATLHRRKGFWCKWFFLMPFRFAQLIIAISPALKTSCLDFKIPREKIWCRFNAVDFEISVKDLAVEPPGVPIILWVGAVTRRKNVRFLLESARHLTGPAKVWFAGPCSDAAYFRELQEIQKKVPPQIEIKFLGLIEDRAELIRLYSQARLFWFASKKEGMGNVVAESLVCGTPVVTLPVMGIMRQVIPSPEDGEIVDTRDPKEFAAAVSRWLVKKTDRAAVSKRARDRFNAARVDGQYLVRFEKILKTGRHLLLKNELYAHPALVSGRI